MTRRSRSLALALVLLAHASAAHAWDKHPTLMPGILKGISEYVTTEKGQPMGEALARSYPAPCPEEDRATYAKLASELKLHPRPKGDGINGILPTNAEACARKQPVTGLDILATFVADEPDFGMDIDLPYPPESYDPDGFQKFMGGVTGPTSQGFRHMYFGGWQFWHPIHTFQIPTKTIGLGPERAMLMAHKAREMIRQGGTRAAWGFRVLGWAIHYVQDLTQPFHSTQVPSTRMVPWHVAMQWPPQKGFEELVSETTRTISNYHFAYEQYTRTRVQEPRSLYAECLERPDLHASLREDPRQDEIARDPKVLALRTARASVQLAPEVGTAVVAFFGPKLKERGVDLPNKKGTPDYADMALRPDLVAQREQLRKVSCVALGNASWATRAMISWVVSPPAVAPQ